MLTRAEEDLIRQGGRGVTAEIILRKEKAFRAPVDKKIGRIRESRMEMQRGYIPSPRGFISPTWPKKGKQREKNGEVAGRGRKNLYASPTWANRPVFHLPLIKKE